MQRRNRKLVGTIILLVFVVVYALVAMALAQSRPLQEAGKLVQGICYALLGLGWILPVMPLIKWMEGGADPSRDQ